MSKWQALKRIHRSIAVLSATLIGAVTTIMLLCAAALLIRFGGDDDGTWAAADVADALKAAVTRNEAGQLALKHTSRLEEITRNFPTFWYVSPTRVARSATARCRNGVRKRRWRHVTGRVSSPMRSTAKPPS
ncbi:hypothetical protein [Bradyrhizobium tropiciagri]|uniref:hypothetical protein n=1 Tax=Bradyrhizobium tropiciagri TaxID=312253 RepID=UPI003221C9CD